MTIQKIIQPVRPRDIPSGTDNVKGGYIPPTNVLPPPPPPPKAPPAKK